MIEIIESKSNRMKKELHTKLEEVKQLRQDIVDAERKEEVDEVLGREG